MTGLGNQASAMTKIEKLLFDYNLNKNALRFKQEKINSLRDSVKSNWATNVSSGGTHALPDEGMVSKVEFIQKLEAELQELQDKVNFVEAVMGVLDDDLKKLVKLRYFERRPWGAVCGELCVTARTAFNWRRRLFEIGKAFLC